jgi:type II secretory pathway predicted ATPase ExeA
MYRDFYQLREKPFPGTPNPGFYFVSRSHREALATLTYGLENGKGFIVLTGDDGLGKTTFLHACLNEIKGAEKKVVCFVPGRLSFLDLLRMIARKLELEVIGKEISLLTDIYNALKKIEKEKRLVLLIDDAQDLSIETLERLLVLSNMEKPKEKLIQVVLAGRPEMESKFNLQELRQLKQRIVLKITLAPLNKKESLEYIQFHLKRAGGQPASIFTPKALDKIIGYSKGNSRTINSIGEKALVLGYRTLQKKVSVKIVKEVIHNLDRNKPKFEPRLVSASLPFLLLGLGLFGFFTFSNSLTGRNNPRFTTPIATLEPTRFLPPEKNKKDNPLSITKTWPIGNQERIAPDGLNTVLNQKTQAPASDNPSFINNLQFAPEKPKKKEKANKLKGNKEQFPIIKTIKKGDNIYRLTLNVYGFSNQELLEFVKKYNPKIKGNNEIRVGERIIFPYWGGKKQRGLVEMEKTVWQDS